MTTLNATRALPKFVIDSKLASERIKKFQSSKHQVLSKAMGKEDTRSIWYSAKHIEELYKSLTELNADGLRVYFGEYSETHNLYPGQLCLIMVPTRLDPETKDHADILVQEEAAVEDTENYIGSVPAQGKFFAYNYGSPCPPVCPGLGLKYPL